MGKFSCRLIIISLVFLVPVLTWQPVFSEEARLQRIQYNNPGLEVDLGVGLWAWPLPMDYDLDGDYDLLVSCPDLPSNGIYFFENVDGDVKMPRFKPGVRIGTGQQNIQPSYIKEQVRLLIPGHELVDFRKTNFNQTKRIYPTDRIHDTGGRIRANQWQYCDYDNDGSLDLLVGIGDWSDYGWDNAFDSTGRWQRGPLHGFVYLIKNIGTTDNPEYAGPEKLVAGGRDIDVYGMPSPNFADFDGDGDDDIICGEFLDRFTYFDNIGTPQQPVFARGVILTFKHQPIQMNLQMIVPVAIDWDKDGDIDLVVGQEDGRVALVENTGTALDRMPQFLPPQFFRQQAAAVKFGALVTPFSHDWDGDGDADLICGNTAGYIGFIENLDDGHPPRWAAPVYLTANDEIIRIQAGENGSIQGPCEAKWGYTTVNVADWNHDSLPDIIVNSIWGKVLWCQNVGSRQAPKLTAAQAIEVEWPGKPAKPAWTWWQPEGKQLVTQWRTTPVVFDWNHDGLNDLIMLDHEGYLALFQRVQQNGELKLLPGARIFISDGPSVFDSKHQPLNDIDGLLQLNAGSAGKSGRRKLCLVDWDGDGSTDLLVNSVNINFLRNIRNDNGQVIFHDLGQVHQHILAGHSTSPTVVDWNKDSVPDLLIGAEDGYLYYLKNPGNKGD